MTPHLATNAVSVHLGKVGRQDTVALLDPVGRPDPAGRSTRQVAKSASSAAAPFGGFLSPISMYDWKIYRWTSKAHAVCQSLSVYPIGSGALCRRSRPFSA